MFSLLEALYSSFDEIAHEMGVFKVETIGDSYFAVCGLPEPNEDHAEVMARFAMACLDRMSTVTSELEIFLGPSTAELEARVGLHVSTMNLRMLPRSPKLISRCSLVLLRPVFFVGRKPAFNCKRIVSFVPAIVSPACSFLTNEACELET